MLDRPDRRAPPAGLLYARLNHAIVKHLSVSTVIGDHLLPTRLWPS